MTYELTFYHVIDLTLVFLLLRKQMWQLYLELEPALSRAQRPGITNWLAVNNYPGLMSQKAF